MDARVGGASLRAAPCWAPTKDFHLSRRAATLLRALSELEEERWELESWANELQARDELSTAGRRDDLADMAAEETFFSEEVRGWAELCDRLTGCLEAEFTRRPPKLRERPLGIRGPIRTPRRGTTGRQRGRRRRATRNTRAGPSRPSGGDEPPPEPELDLAVTDGGRLWEDGGASGEDEQEEPP